MKNIKTHLILFSLAVMVLISACTSPETSTSPSAPTAKQQECPFLTPEMVKEVCNLDSAMGLTFYEELGADNCGVVETAHLSDMVIALQVDAYYAHPEEYTKKPSYLGEPLDIPSTIRDYVQQKDKEYRMIEGVGDQAFITTINAKNKLADIESLEPSKPGEYTSKDGFFFYFSSKKDQISGTLKVYNYALTAPDEIKVPGCSVEEVKQLVIRILERLPDS